MKYKIIDISQKWEVLKVGNQQSAISNQQSKISNPKATEKRIKEWERIKETQKTPSKKWRGFLNGQLQLISSQWKV